MLDPLKDRGLSRLTLAYLSDLLADRRDLALVSGHSLMVDRGLLREDHGIPGDRKRDGRGRAAQRARP